LPLPSLFVTHPRTEACNTILPLGCLPVAVWPVAQLRKLSTGLGLENGLKRIFEQFPGAFCASPRLACENFGCHVGYSLVLFHSLSFFLAHSPE
jgi:hypothetical protein